MPASGTPGTGSLPHSLWSRSQGPHLAQAPLGAAQVQGRGPGVCGGSLVGFLRLSVHLGSCSHRTTTPLCTGVPREWKGTGSEGLSHPRPVRPSLWHWGSMCPENHKCPVDLPWALSPCHLLRPLSLALRTPMYAASRSCFLSWVMSPYFLMRTALKYRGQRICACDLVWGLLHQESRHVSGFGA